jgi:putative membrane protein insertion efficiency factor
MIERLVVALLAGYKLLISPFVPPCCRFVPTCSDYARLTLMEHGLLRGTGLALLRLARCHPFHPGGYDPPPPARNRLA